MQLQQKGTERWPALLASSRGVWVRAGKPAWRLGAAVRGARG